MKLPGFKFTSKVVTPRKLTQSVPKDVRKLMRFENNEMTSKQASAYRKEIASKAIRYLKGKIKLIIAKPAKVKHR